MSGQFSSCWCAPDIRIVGVGEKNLPVGHLVVDVPPSEGAVEVGEGVVDPFLHFLRQITAGVAVQPVWHLGAWIHRWVIFSQVP